MVKMRTPIQPADIIAEVNYVVFLYEPSTDWRSLKGIANYVVDAKKLAKAQVDDACKTEGWLYKRFEDVFLPIGYAFLEGDGGIGYKALISDHVYMVKETQFGDGEEILPGWYFADETEQGHGPFGTVEEANAAFVQYAEMLEGPSV